MPRIADLDLDVPTTLERLGIEICSERGDWVDALCPFHEEGDPSFSVNLEHGGWIDRHGEAKGQLLDLISQLKGISRADAADWVRRAGPVDSTTVGILQKLFSTQENPEDKRIILDSAEKYDRLSPKLMAEYWFERGFTARTMRQFKVRYDEEEGCLVWPIRDENANILGFIKRKVPPFYGKSKYIYQKGLQRMLFPLDHFRGEEVILVEGPLDALWLHQYGYTGALAVLGSGLTRSQVSWLKTRAEKVILAFDNDRDGRRGRNQVIAQLAGINTLVTTLPLSVKDVQELDEKSLRSTIEGATSALLSTIKRYST
ncbi:hypothetical protein LCGC14_1407940 [marine sediment metagenome]|uniref:Toprim domain-containing protein n=1 Tax=marine sediment metagenome TaxID=412755 RepID=A0A0F9JVD5_9ZZZZ